MLSIQGQEFKTDINYIKCIYVCTHITLFLKFKIFFNKYKNWLDFQMTCKFP